MVLLGDIRLNSVKLMRMRERGKGPSTNRFRPPITDMFHDGVRGSALNPRVQNNQDKNLLFWLKDCWIGQ